MTKNTNVEFANSFSATIEFNDFDDARKWRRKFGTTAIASSTGCKMLLEVERDEDESYRLKGLCDLLYQYKITSHLKYEQYSVEQPYYIAVAQEYVTECVTWILEFGDYDRDVVKQEIADLKYADKYDGVKRKYKLIKCSDADQVTIDAAIAFQNFSSNNK